MSIFSAENFIRRYGRSTLKRFYDRCNDGASLGLLAREFRMSVPTASRLRSTLFERRWVLRKDVKDYLNFKIDYHEGEVDDHRELLEKDSLLTYIPGGIAESQGH